MNVHLIDRTSAEGQALQEVVDRFLVTAEEKARKRLRMLLHLTDGGIHILVGEDREKRSKDLVLHDRIVPRHRIEDGRIDVPRPRIGRAASNDLLLIDETCQAFYGLWA